MNSARPAAPGAGGSLRANFPEAAGARSVPFGERVKRKLRGVTPARLIISPGHLGEYQ
jgi:hypothetical protein